MPLHRHMHRQWRSGLDVCDGVDVRWALPEGVRDSVTHRLLSQGWCGPHWAEVQRGVFVVSLVITHYFGVGGVWFIRGHIFFFLHCKQNEVSTQQQTARRASARSAGATEACGQSVDGQEDTADERPSRTREAVAERDERTPTPVGARDGTEEAQHAHP